MKKIAAVVKYFYPVAAGIETNMLETYSLLVARGWQVTVHTTSDTLTEKNVLAEKEQVRGITVRRTAYRWYSYLPAIDWEAEVVALHNFNILPQSFILLYVGLQRLRGNKMPKVMLTPHGGFTPDWQIFPPLVAFIKWVYHRTVGTLLINWTVDVVRTVSAWEQKQIIASGVRPEKVVTITNGIEQEAYTDLDKKVSTHSKQVVQKYGKYLIKIARIYDIKNYETIINALTKLPQDINFVIVGPVGSEAYLEKLKKMIKDLYLAQRVFFAGVVRGYDKYYLIKKSLLMVHMARWESFCNAVHEGMSQGKVCLVANNSALSYLIKDGENGYLLDTFNSDALAEKITYVLDPKNAKEVAAIQKHNVTITRTQTWKNVADQVNQILVNI